MNEFSIIEKIKTLSQIKLPSTIQGIGDDCAVFPKDNKTNWLISTDSLIEGIHFLKQNSSPSIVAKKALAVNLSDIAAMGGTPHHCLLSIAIPQNTPDTWTESFINEFTNQCNAHNVTILGGDTCRSLRDTYINLTLLGTSPKKNTLYRHNAKPTNYIALTGYIGDSAAGLFCLKNELPNTAKATDYFIHCHLEPKAHLAEGQWLGQQKGVTAMMDLSDGLDCDLKKLLQASQCGANIALGKIPLSPFLQSTQIKFPLTKEELACSGGEDYCLLCTINESDSLQIQQSFFKEFKRELYIIGKCTNNASSINYQRNGINNKLNINSFSHF